MKGPTSATGLVPLLPFHLATCPISTQRPFQILLSESLLSQTLILVDKQLHLTTTGKNTPFILSFNLMDDGQSQE